MAWVSCSGYAKWTGFQFDSHLPDFTFFCLLLTFFRLTSHVTLTGYVLPTMGVNKESISKFLIGNRFHVKLCILSPYSNIGLVLG